MLYTLSFMVSVALGILKLTTYHEWSWWLVGAPFGITVGVGLLLTGFSLALFVMLDPWKRRG